LKEKFETEVFTDEMNLIINENENENSLLEYILDFISKKSE